MADKFAKFVSNDYRGMISRRRSTAGVRSGGRRRTAFRIRPGPVHADAWNSRLQHRRHQAALRAHGVENHFSRSPHVPCRGLPKRSRVLRRPHGMEAAERRWNTGGDGHRDWGSVIFKQAPAGTMDDSAAAGGGRGGPPRAVVESFCFVIDQWNAKKVERTCESAALRQLPKTATTGSKASM